MALSVRRLAKGGKVTKVNGFKRFEDRGEVFEFGDVGLLRGKLPHQREQAHDAFKRELSGDVRVLNAVLTPKIPRFFSRRFVNHPIPCEQVSPETGIHLFEVSLTEDSGSLNHERAKSTNFFFSDHGARAAGARVIPLPESAPRTAVMHLGGPSRGQVGTPSAGRTESAPGHLDDQRVAVVELGISVRHPAGVALEELMQLVGLSADVEVGEQLLQLRRNGSPDGQDVDEDGKVEHVRIGAGHAAARCWPSRWMMKADGLGPFPC